MTVGKRPSPLSTPVPTAVPVPKTVLNSNWQTFFLLVKGNIGPGCLALPYSFSMLGATESLRFLLVVAVLCITNMWLLVACKQKVPGVKTYGELGWYAFGRKGEVVIEVFLTVSQLSICCVYISFISNGIAPLVGVSNRAVIILLIAPMGIISQYRHMRELAPLSIVASVLLVCALCIIGFICVHNLGHNGQPDNMPMFDSSKVVLFLVSTVYAFEGIGIILPIEGAMQQPDQFVPILAVSMTLVTVIYILFGEIVIMSFGYIEDAGITRYLVTVGSVPTAVAGLVSVLVSTAVLLSYPLQLYPALQVIEIYFSLDSDESTAQHLSQSPHNGGQGDSGCIQKYITPFFNKMYSTLVFFNILKENNDPLVVIYSSPEYKRKRKPTRIFSYQATHSLDSHQFSEETADIREEYYNVQRSHSMTELETPRYRTFSQDSDPNEGDGLMQYTEELRFAPEQHVSGDASPRPLSSIKSLDPEDISFIRSFLRCFLVICTSLVAAFIPNIGLLVSLAGATSGTSLALIFPPLLEISISRIQHIRMSYSRLLFCVVSAVVGVTGAVIGTVISLKDICDASG